MENKITRIGAGTYLLTMSTAINLWCAAMIIAFKYVITQGPITSDQVEYLMWGLAAPVGYLFFRLSKGRFQDLNCPASWARILAFPFFGVMVLPVLCFLSGHRYSNDFGDPPEPSGFFKLLLAFISFCLALLLVHYVIRLYSTLHI